MISLATPASFSVREESEVEISLLVAHKAEIKWTGFGFVACVGAGDRKSAHEGRLVACV